MWIQEIKYIIPFSQESFSTEIRHFRQQQDGIEPYTIPEPDGLCNQQQISWDNLIIGLEQATSDNNSYSVLNMHVFTHKNMSKLSPCTYYTVKYVQWVGGVVCSWKLVYLYGFGVVPNMF